MDSNSKEKVYIDLVHYPLSTLGPLERIGVWFQGCNIYCKDCISPHNFIQTEDKIMSINELSNLLINMNSCNKITISGGEPFYQPNALYELLLNIRFKFDDILIYSGYKFEDLVEKHSKIFGLIDVLIDGPFKKELPTNKIYKGSKNQRMFIFNKNLIELYSNYMSIDKKMLQIHKTKEKMYLLGIPEIQDSKYIIQLINGGNNV